MLTKFEVENHLYSLLKASEVATEINGGVYPDGQRPQSSTKEDAEIITTTATADAMAEGSVNVLVFVPDVTQSGSKSAKVANRPRLTKIARLLGDFAEGLKADGDYLFKPKEAVYTSDYEELGQHAAVLRLSFKHYNHD